MKDDLRRSAREIVNNSTSDGRVRWLVKMTGVRDFAEECEP
jgi:hypothetical protein